MKHRYLNWISKILQLLDITVLNLCFTLTYLAGHKFEQSAFVKEFVIFIFYFNILWLVISQVAGLHHTDKIRNIKALTNSTFISSVVFIFFFLLYFQILGFNYIDRDSLKYIFVIFVISLFVNRLIFYIVIPLYNRVRNNFTRVVILGYNKTSRFLSDRFMNDALRNYKVLGFFSDQPMKNHKDYLGRYDDFKNFIEQNQVDEIFLISSEIPKNTQLRIIYLARNQSVNIHLVPAISSMINMDISLSSIGPVPVLHLERGPLNKIQNIALKRIFDILISSMVILLVLSWLIPVIGLINRLLYKQSVFFVQKRNGLNNKTFHCYKFKTMKTNEESDYKNAEKSDSRVTPMGLFLRKTGLDELPQFFNVFSGQMSVVGPRPHMLMHTNQYRRIVNKFMIRHTVKPGITGLAQVSGCRGSITHFSQIRKRVNLDIRYIETWSFGLDIKIFFATIYTIFKSEPNAY